MRRTCNGQLPLPMAFEISRLISSRGPVYSFSAAQTPKDTPTCTSGTEKAAQLIGSVLARQRRYSVESQAALDLFLGERVACAETGSSCWRNSSASLRPCG